MKFGPLATQDAEGAILAHTIRLEAGALKKGHRLSADDLLRLSDAGIGEIVAARLEPGECHEDRAAERLARAADGGGMTLEPPFTGRVNFLAASDGVLVIDEDAVDAVNRVDPALTLATLPAYARVTRGRMVATAKVIPFAVGEASVARAEAVARQAVRVAPFRARKVGLVATELPHLKPSVMDKTRRITEARLDVSGSTLIAEHRVAHETQAVADALTGLMHRGAEMLLVFGASAIVDRGDVIPAAIESAGGTVVHFGMPVDPGNLLLVGDIGGIPVIGAPGCARSPSENGFDWVLDRLMADLPVTAQDITGLGVGGLLMEIGSRPQPREGKRERTTTSARRREVAGLLLAAGRSSRARGTNKLLARLEGKPLVRIAAENALASGLSRLVVVTGHMHGEIRDALAGLDIDIVHNPDFAEGMGGSIRTGMRALPQSAEAVLVLLADMPGIDAGVIDRLIGAYRPEAGRAIIAAAHEGTRGNPVLFDRLFFARLARLEGDTGARRLIGENSGLLAEVEIGEAARHDLDTREALAEAGAEMPEERA